MTLLLALMLSAMCPDGYREDSFELLKTDEMSSFALYQMPDDVVPIVVFCDNLGRRDSSSGVEGQIVGQADLFIVSYTNRRMNAQFVSASRPRLTKERIIGPLLPDPACRGADVLLLPGFSTTFQVIPVPDQREIPALLVGVSMTVLGSKAICTDETHQHELFFALAAKPTPKKGR